MNIAKEQLIKELQGLIVGLCKFFRTYESQLPDYVVIMLCQQIENLTEIVEELKTGKERYDFLKQIITHAISELLITFDGHVLPNLQNTYAQISTHEEQLSTPEIRVVFSASSFRR